MNTPSGRTPTTTPAPVAVTSHRHGLGPIDPTAAYAALSGRFGRDDVYLLESVAGPAQDTRLSFVGFGELLAVTVTRGAVRVTGEPTLVAAVEERVAPALDRDDAGAVLSAPDRLWDVLRAIHTCFDAEGSADEFSFGFLAFFGYDTARYIEELPYLIEQDAELPDVALVLYQGQVRVDADGIGELVLHEAAGWPEPAAADLLPLLVGHPGIDAALPAAGASDSLDSTTPGHYEDSVERCLEHIAAGDIYQVQIGHELSMRSTAEPLDVYRRLRARNPSPYMYLAPLAGHVVVGASPELFAKSVAGVVTMRPIAGTLPCGPDDDAMPDAASRLREDPKEIAEHVMLVDLCRNDIGRICTPGTLDVPQMLVVERYSRLLHLVSTVVGRQAEGTDVYDLIAALFPAGTMTGAPKIRAMEIIEAVESSRRGMYAGALGLIDIGGHANLALCIRTLVYHDGVYRARASAGVVGDSVPEHEWDETLAKLGAARWATAGAGPPA